MRIVSLTPSATEIVFALGLGDELVGRTHRCDYPAAVLDVPVVTVDDLEAPGRTLDGTLLAKLEPDLVLTDGSEERPVVDYGEVSDIVGGMARETTLVALAPHTVEGILNSISTVGAYTESEFEAVGLVEMLRERLGAIDLGIGPETRRVVVIESLRAPAGRRPLGTRDGPARRGLGAARSRGRVAGAHDLAAGTRGGPPGLGAGAPRTRTPLVLKRRSTSVALPPWFDELPAVRDGEFFAVDGAGLFARPGPRVVEGIAVLAELCYPEVFAGAGPVEAWRPLAPVGIAGRYSTDEGLGRS